MAAGTATLQVIQQQNLAEHAASVGQRLADALRQVQRRHDCIGEVRGRGLMIGVEIVDVRQPPDRLGSRPADTKLARAIQQQCLRLGIVIELGGRHGCVLRFLPPLIVTAEENDVIAQRFSAAVDSAVTERMPLEASIH